MKWCRIQNLSYHCSYLGCPLVFAIIKKSVKKIFSCSIKVGAILIALLLLYFTEYPFLI